MGNWEFDRDQLKKAVDFISGSIKQALPNSELGDAEFDKAAAQVLLDLSVLKKDDLMEYRRILSSTQKHYNLETSELMVLLEEASWTNIYIFDDDNGRKIGITSNSVKSRLSTVQTGNPKKITCAKSWRCKKANDVEKAIKSSLESSRHPGGTEWFDISVDEMMDIAKAACKSAGPCCEECPGND